MIFDKKYCDEIIEYLPKVDYLAIELDKFGGDDSRAGTSFGLYKKNDDIKIFEIIVKHLKNAIEEIKNDI